MTDMNTEAALCCMIVSNPAGGERPHAWQRRVNDLIRAQRDTITALRQREAEAVAGAIEAAAHLVSATAYTSNGDRRSLEPVSKGLEGQDMHHATISTAIRSLHTDATRAALDRVRAEGMRAAVEIAHRMASTDANMNRTWRAGCEDVAEAIHRAADKLEGKS